MRWVMRSKIHNATVTEANLAYVGSITIDAALIERAGVWPGERVLVVSNTSGARLETYVIEGERGSGAICVNGAAAHLIGAGEEIIVMGFELTPEPVTPRVILVDRRNRFVGDLAERPMLLDTPAPFRDTAEPRHDWTLDEVEALFERPFTELVFQAAEVHRRWFDPTELQISQLLSVKTGGCPETCGYCAQSQHFKTGVAASKLMDADAVIAKAREAKAGGAQRFCMGAAWRDLKDRDVPKVAAMISGVKALGLETCATLGMLTPEQAKRLKAAGLDFYNHNLDTGPDYYDQVVTTRTYQERLDTLAAVRDAGVSTCCGGIVGMGETRRDRAGLLHQLAILPSHPESLPINDLMPIAGTPLGSSTPIDELEFVRMIAVARLVCPKSVVRIAAGRDRMSKSMQALCFLAGANSIFVGGRLLTTNTPDPNEDEALLADLKMRPMRPGIVREPPPKAMGAA